MNIALSKWAAQNFDPAPHRNTLSKWRADGMIYPVPKLIGKTYYVDDQARYIGKKTGAGTVHGRRLIDRVQP